jgi:hypothetical protein
VEDLDGRVGGVDPLAAVAAGAADLDAEFVGLDDEVDLLGLGQDGDGGGRGVDAALAFGGRDPLDPVDAALVAEPLVDIISDGLESRFSILSPFRSA